MADTDDKVKAVVAATFEVRMEGDSALVKTTPSVDAEFYMWHGGFYGKDRAKACIQEDVRQKSDHICDMARLTWNMFQHMRSDNLDITDCEAVLDRRLSSIHMSLCEMYIELRRLDAISENLPQKTATPPVYTCNYICHDSKSDSYHLEKHVQNIALLPLRCSRSSPKTLMDSWNESLQYRSSPESAVWRRAAPPVADAVVMIWKDVPLPEIDETTINETVTAEISLDQAKVLLAETNSKACQTCASIIIIHTHLSGEKRQVRLDAYTPDQLRHRVILLFHRLHTIIGTRRMQQGIVDRLEPDDESNKTVLTFLVVYRDRTNNDLHIEKKEIRVGEPTSGNFTYYSDDVVYNAYARERFRNSDPKYVVDIAVHIKTTPLLDTVS